MPDFFRQLIATILFSCLPLLVFSESACGGSTLLHNSDRFACNLPLFSSQDSCESNGGIWSPSRKWFGGWGLPDKQYGEVACGTCHVRGPANGNIKRIRPSITAPDGTVFPNNAGEVVARQAIPAVSSDFGNDADEHAISKKICEVCHSKTNYHRYNTAGQSSLNHFNAEDCVACHRHNAGFRAGCGDCHGNSDTGTAWPDGVANNINPSYAAIDDDAGPHAGHVAALGNNASCANCHPSAETSSVHLDGTVDLLTTGFTYEKSTQSCSSINCHGGTNAKWRDGGACLDCHASVQGNRAAVKGQFSANSHHVQGVTVTNALCYQCHWEANSDGTINPTYHGGSATPGATVDLVIYGTASRPTGYASGTTAVQYKADGSRSEIARLNQHCLGCHSDSNSTTTPFGDGKTPQQYAWDKTVEDPDGTSVASRYNQTQTTSWGKYSGVNVTPKATRFKAYSAHGNATANQGGWDLNETWPDKRAGSVNVACFDCHNSHGSSVTGRTVSYAESGGGILKTTTSGLGGYAVSYKPMAGGSATDKNQRNAGASLCFDCHLTGTAGVSTPWGYATTFGATEPILGYFDTAHFAPGNSGPQQRFPYRQANALKGGHFGASSALKSAATKPIGGLCTPCHDPHGVSPNLSNQAYGVPLLRGTWMTSPYREDVSPLNNNAYTHRSEGVPYRINENTFGPNIYTFVSGIGESASVFSDLCLQCHPRERLTDGITHTWKSKDRIHESVSGWKSAGTPEKHKFPCAKCHSPHVSTGLPRLMVTNCLDATHKGRSPGQIPYVNGDQGRIPGSYYQWDPEENGLINCHEGANPAASDTDQSWNNVTPWYSELPLVITAGPTSTPSGIYNRASIAWTTNLQSSSWVDYGPTASYGSSTGNNYYYPSHTIQLTGLTNHSTYHYRVRSTSNGGQTVTSADQTFYLSIPPTVPNTIVEPDKGCPDSCLVTVSWYPSSDIDGGPIQYEVVVDDDSTFATPDASSGWISGTVSGSTRTATVGPLGTGKTWYWRVRSRDANYIGVVSAWSAVKSFMTMVSYPPPGMPTFYASPSFVTCADNCSFTLNWSTSISDPDNGPVQYSVEIDDDPAFASLDAASGWIATTSWLTSPLATEKTWYCRVQARYADHQEAVSGWSATKSVVTLYPPPTVPVLIAEPAYTVCPGSCSMPLAWNASTAYNNGAVEYYVEVDDDSVFASLNVVSGWVSDTTWAASPLDTNKTWYWRVRARDAAHPAAVSAWSGPGTFRTMTVPPPPVPGIAEHADYDSGCADTVVTVWWQPVTSPDGHQAEYYVQTDSVGASGWLPALSNSWSFTLPAGWGVTWKVMARDAVHPEAMSAWSASDYFYDIGSQCWSSSCPLVFGWTGSGYDYKTDLAGPIIGLRPTATDRSVSLFHPEVAFLDGLVPDAEGKYRAKIRESLPEITYLDTVSLLAVDAPEGYEVHTSWAETTYVYGYAHPFRIYTSKDSLLPMSASASDGVDVLASMLAVDNTPAHLDPMNKNFFYTIDFGAIERPQYAKLLIDGWTLYSVDAFTAPSLVQPFIEVVDQNGNWVKVKSFGTPAGDLKTMVVDLSNIFLSNDHRIRLYTGLRQKSRWLIDRIRLDQSAPVNVDVHEIFAENADLQFAGNAIQLMSDLGTRIIASDASLPVEPHTGGVGNFTRYGDVASLLTEIDDKFAIMRQGDKVDLVFPAPPQQQAGLTRYFVLKSDLYYKSLVVLNEVEPLPFHDMSSYPYPETESYPADAEHQRYREEYNTRIISP